MNEDKIIELLEKFNIDLVCTLPCVSLKKLIKLVESSDKFKHIILNREEEGIGICAGAYLAGKRSVMIIQNSALGNSANAINTLLSYYDIPMIFLISHRGSDIEPIEAQKWGGNATIPLLNAINIEYEEVKFPDQISKVENAFREVFENGRKKAILIHPNFLGVTWEDLSLYRR